MIVDLANDLGVTVSDVESHHTLDQLFLRWYLNVKRERREQDLSAQLTAAHLANNIAKMFGG